MKFFVLIFLFLVTACDDCSSPTKKVCVKRICNPVVVMAGRVPVVSTVCRCVAFAEIENECYNQNEGE